MPAKIRAMGKQKTPPAAEQKYQQLRQQLASLGPISQGSVQDRTARKGGGAGYQWTRKVAGKTVTVSLTSEQFARMKEAVGNYRQLRRQLRKMENLTRQMIFRSCPHPHRRKKLTSNVLGTN